MAARAKPHAAVKILEVRDRFTEYGQALLVCTDRHESPAERLLDVLRLVLTFATGILNSSADAQDATCTIVGQHYLSRRGLGHAVDGGQLVVKIQEICSFDSKEMPRNQRWDQQGRQLARMHVKLCPVTKAKTRKLGREAYLKINLNTEGVVLLQRSVAAATAHAEQQQLQQGQQGQQQGQEAPAQEEEYQFSLPALILVDPLSAGGCLAAFKGDITISCPTTGWAASVTLSEDGRVSGHMDQQLPRSAVTGPSGANQANKSAPAGKGAPGSFASVGTFSGSWKGAITLNSATLGLTGPVIQLGAPTGAAPGAQAAGKGVPLGTLDLTALPPMQLPRLWSAILDSIMFNDPAQATGRGALDLSRAMARRLSGYPLATDDLLSGPGAPASTQAKSTAAGSAPGGDDSDDELLMSGGGSSAKTAAAQASKAVQPHVPPCVLSQHASGKRLAYQLQLVAVQMPSDLIKHQ